MSGHKSMPKAKDNGPFQGSFPTKMLATPSHKNTLQKTSAQRGSGVTKNELKQAAEYYQYRKRVGTLPA